MSLWIIGWLVDRKVLRRRHVRRVSDVVYGLRNKEWRWHLSYYVEIAKAFTYGT